MVSVERHVWNGVLHFVSLSGTNFATNKNNCYLIKNNQNFFDDSIYNSGLKWAQKHNKSPSLLLSNKKTPLKQSEQLLKQASIFVVLSKINSFQFDRFQMYYVLFSMSHANLLDVMFCCWLIFACEQLQHLKEIMKPLMVSITT